MTLLRHDYLKLGRRGATVHQHISAEEWGLDAVEKARLVIEKVILHHQVTDALYLWRAGLAFLPPLYKFSDLHHHHLGVRRNEENPEQNEVYLPLSAQKFSQTNAARKVLICDPMLATGNSLLTAIAQLIACGISQDEIVIACIVAAPEGIELVQQKYPTIDIFAGVVDEKLDENSYIVPGLGDFGDKFWAYVRKYGISYFEDFRDAFDDSSWKELQKKFA